MIGFICGVFVGFASVVAVAAVIVAGKGEGE